MSNRALLEIVAGCFLGTAIATGMIFGILELADIIVGWSHEFSR